MQVYLNKDQGARDLEIEGAAHSVRVEPGGSVEVPDEIAQSLIAQGSWSEGPDQASREPVAAHVPDPPAQQDEPAPVPDAESDIPATPVAAADGEPVPIDVPAPEAAGVTAEESAAAPSEPAAGEPPIDPTQLA